LVIVPPLVIMSSTNRIVRSSTLPMTAPARTSAADAFLVDDGQVAVQEFGVPAGGLDVAHVGRDHRQVRQVHAAEVLDEDRLGQQVVYGDVEEALDLVRVQVDRDDAVDARRLEHVGHELGADRHSPFILAVLPRVTVVGNDGRDAVGAGAVSGVDEEQEFHQVVVLRRAGGLNDEDVPAANVLGDFDERLAVGKPREHDLAERFLEVLGNGLRQGAVGAAGEDFQLVHVILVPGKFQVSSYKFQVNGHGFAALAWRDPP
jgi:hypothetical protein